MRRGEDFSLAVRRGRRAGSTHLALHLIERPGCVEHARVGLVVSKAVGNAVVRTRVKRRLRAVAASRLDRLPGGSLVVLRATPASAGATSEQLGAALDRTLGRVVPALRSTP
jgi:ribonuclease P protein component